ncbi:MAG TPA: ABC transporter substrate-binding protein [Solirubrobacteraceae bacterium]|nr:ABC transporter substrate-binding protein [Solirubrobacteraceae bacterium]
MPYTRATRTRRAPLSSVAAAFVAVLALAACGSSTPASAPKPLPKHHRAKPKPPVLDFYSSLPLTGQWSAVGNAILRGIQLKLGQVGDRVPGTDFIVKLVSLDDVPRPHTGQDPLSRAAENASEAATDPKAIYYIGDLSSSQATVSVQILKQWGVPQISPLSPNVGTEPLLRLMPGDGVQAAAAASELHSLGCVHVSGISDRDSAGNALLQTIATDAKADGLSMTRTQATVSSKVPPAAVIASLHAQNSGSYCFVFAGRPSAALVALSKTAHLDYPKSYILGTSGLCNSAWTAPIQDSDNAYCTSAVLPIDSYKQGRTFTRWYVRKYRKQPSAELLTYALYGYEAANLGVETIQELGDHLGSSRSQVRRWLFATSYRPSPLGLYGFDANGETTLRTYGLYKVAANGAPAFLKKLTPPY